MMFKKTLVVSMVLLSGLAGAGSVFANTVTIHTNKPMTVTYQIAHQSKEGVVTLSKLKTEQVSGDFPESMQLGDDRYVGVMIDSVAGHQLPPSVKQFGHQKSCSVRTDQVTPNGNIQLTFEKAELPYHHKITCKHS